MNDAFAQPASISNFKKEAYKQLADAMNGRLESEIGLNEPYWQILAAIRLRESNNMWSVEPTEVVLEPAKVKQQAPEPKSTVGFHNPFKK